jgi:hypothetical protein
MPEAIADKEENVENVDWAESGQRRVQIKKVE